MSPRIVLSEVERLTLEELSHNHPFRDFRPRALGILALNKGHRPPVGGGDSGGALPNGVQLGKRLANPGIGGLAERPQGRASGQADGGDVGHGGSRGARGAARVAGDCPPGEGGAPRRARLQPGPVGRGAESAWTVVETDPVVAKKKRCPERFEAARHDLTRRQIAALEYATGRLWHEAHDKTVRRENVVDLIDRIAQRAGAKALTVVVLDNASMHHDIDPEKLDEWLIDHRLVLMHLPPYSPELNLIETVWRQAKYHWRRFETWAKDQVHEEVSKLMQGFGSAYQISFA